MSPTALRVLTLHRAIQNSSLRCLMAPCLLVCCTVFALASPSHAQESVPTPQAETQDDDAPKLATLKEKASYSIGFNIGSDISGEELGIDLEMLIRGIRDAAAGKQHPLSPEDVQAVMNAFQREVSAKQQAKFEEMAQKNKTEGEAFLRQNAEKEGVKVLENGLQYKVLKQGDGDSPQKDSTVLAHYRGRFPDGEVFDSSYDRGEPFKCNVGLVIRGWTEALQRMKVGDTWELYVPSNLAYGTDGFPPAIGPNQVLIFEIELIDIVE